MSHVTKEQKAELTELSKQVFGSANRWNKILDKGLPTLITRKVTEEVPGENGAEPTKREAHVPVLTESGARQFQTVYHTPESLKEFMLSALKRQEELKAMIAKMQEEQQKNKEAEELRNKVHAELVGTAVK